MSIVATDNGPLTTDKCRREVIMRKLFVLVLVAAVGGGSWFFFQRYQIDGLMPRFVEQINSGGRHYDYVVGPRLGGEPGEQYAFVFDSASVAVDRTTVYTVEDPSRLLRRDPLVATFGVRGPPANEAFTF